MNSNLQLARYARQLLWLTLLCLVVWPLAWNYDLVWLAPDDVAFWVAQDDLIPSYQLAWEWFHHQIDQAGQQGFMPEGYSNWPKDGIPVWVVSAGVALAFSGLFLVMAVILVIRLGSAHGSSPSASGSSKQAMSETSSSGKDGPQYRPVTRALIDSIESNLQACESGLQDAQGRLDQVRQTVMNLSLDPGGIRTEEDLAALRDQLDQLRQSLDRQRGPQHAMMANLSKF